VTIEEGKIFFLDCKMPSLLGHFERKYGKNLDPILSRFAHGILCAY
jgi:hypothetical protein